MMVKGMEKNMGKWDRDYAHARTRPSADESITVT